MPDSPGVDSTATREGFALVPAVLSVIRNMRILEGHVPDQIHR
jgi:hypothetical protein